MNEFTQFDAARQARRITEQAAAWYIEQQAPLSERQRVAFLNWLRASPRHVAEYFAVAQMHGDLKAAAALEKLSTAQLLEQARRDNPIVMFPSRARPAQQKQARARGRYLLAGIAGMAAMALLWLGLGHGRGGQARPGRDDLAQYVTAGAVQSLALADGTLIQLDRDSAIRVRFDDRYRRIEVERGHALFDVGKDALRPMLVSVGGHVLQDIGTIFDVRRAAGGDTLTVISGRVRVLAARPATRKDDEPPLPGAAIADLSAGQQIELDQAGASAVQPAQLAATVAWLPPEIRFQHESIASVARRFNAYTPVPLQIEDPAIAHKRISGVFHADNPQAFVAYLATLPNVRIIRTADRVRVLAADSAADRSQQL